MVGPRWLWGLALGSANIYYMVTRRNYILNLVHRGLPQCFPLFNPRMTGRVKNLVSSTLKMQKMDLKDCLGKRKGCRWMEIGPHSRMAHFPFVRKSKKPSQQVIGLLLICSMIQSYPRLWHAAVILKSV